MLDNSMGKIIGSIITELTKKEQFSAAFLVGSALWAEGDKTNLNDLDLFLIGENGGYFEREVKFADDIKLDISYLPLTLLRQGLKEGWPFLINSFREYKTIFSNPEIEEIAQKLKEKYTAGPGSLTKEEKDYIRFKINEDYESLLSKKDDPLSAFFLTHNLFITLLNNYFPLRGKWTPKGKKVMAEIKKEDMILYGFCEDFYSQVHLEGKIEILLKMMEYILKDSGGIKKTWPKGRFPLK